MTTHKEALTLALDALCTCGPQQKQAIATIKEALAQPEQEPAAWAMLHDNGDFIDAINPEEHARIEGDYKHALYTTPPQRTWVGLTDEDICNLEGFYDCMTKEEFFDAIRGVEAKLKEKNT